MGNIQDELSVEDLKKTITSLVEGAVEGIINRRISDSAFLDNVDVKKRFFTSTCEGIESILIPSSVFPQLTLQKLSEKFPQLPEILFDEADFLIKRIIKSESDLAPGDPYLKRGGSIKKADRNQLPNLDSTSFIVSTLIDIREQILNGNLKVNKEFSSPINDIINDGISTIVKYHIKGKGWPSGIGDPNTHLYFMWSALETLRDVLDIENKDDLEIPEKEIEAIFEETTKWVENEILFDMVNGSLYITTKKKDGSDFIKTYNYLQGLIILNIGKSKQYKDIITFINKFYSVCYRILPNEEYEILYNLDTFKLEDSSIAPLALRGIVPTILDNLGNEEFAKELIKSRLSYSDIISDIIKRISEKRTADKLFASDSEDYELYYTERVIEALTICYRQLDKIESIKVEKFTEGLKEAHS